MTGGGWFSRKPAPPPGAFVPHGKGPKEPLAARAWRLGVFAAAVIGGLLGLGMLWLHLTTDPLADVRAYYDAARRLNEGRPLYLVGGDATQPTYYFYPPLLAIVLRPLALLPYHWFALLWEAVVVASFVALLRQLGATRRTWLAVGLLGMPIGWAIAIAQAHVPMTLLMAIGQPWSIALAANIKLFPILIAIWWIGRREWGSVGALIGWMALLVALQWLLEPANTMAFPEAVGPGQVAGVQNLSPYGVSPWLWLGALGVGIVVALVLAPTRWGWPAAVTLATLASPRLLVYMLMGLLAGIRAPDEPRGDELDAWRRVPDAAEAYVRSAR